MEPLSILKLNSFPLNSLLRFLFSVPVRRVRRPRISRHYQTHKEQARALVKSRLEHFNQFYGFSYGRVAIKNLRSRWGSCSQKRNLNFNYRILFLPTDLQDYVIVHELCHLAEFNHSAQFWAQMQRVMPDARQRRTELRRFNQISL